MDMRHDIMLFLAVSIALDEDKKQAQRPDDEREKDKRKLTRNLASY